MWACVEELTALAGDITVRLSVGVFPGSCILTNCMLRREGYGVRDLLMLSLTIRNLEGLDISEFEL
ncbi:predicted protein [Chaetomium globosum CBS 148.51]|uniref:Uncharacterized protein n=1 Tax=Chaetomium globosum (strain ATCC 6205 / CBS 148.51 / DSM 1962 / NBRC 6347 / NRRL 1970) TaxID=306901 RepID=Q2HFA2_CHAGB|nr:uncharacterized protein CHGG_01102 [Chaetomium globosum CBS 148.51]EAQ92867.1 predicted protein [Chaetomium globosum CBS 148.51]